MLTIFFYLLQVALYIGAASLSALFNFSTFARILLKIVAVRLLKRIFASIIALFLSCRSNV